VNSFYLCLWRIHVTNLLILLSSHVSFFYTFFSTFSYIHVAVADPYPGVLFLFLEELP
jgi:hypothetical protein